MADFQKKDLNYIFKKKANIGVLHKELEAAGFDIYGVSWDGGTNNVTIHFTEDAEKAGIDEKLLQNIIEAHIYVEDVIPDYRGDFVSAISTCKNAKTTDGKLQAAIIALETVGKILGIDVLDKQE